MELTAYLRVIRRRWRLVAAITVVGLLVGIGSFLLLPKQDTVASSSSLYKATHTLIGSKDLNLQQVAAIATNGDVPRRVADRLGGSPGQLSASTVVSPVTQANLLQVTSFSTDPNRAAQVADAFAEELIRYQVEVADRQRQTSVDALQQQRESLKVSYDEILTKAGADPDPAKQEDYKRAKDDLVRRGKDIDAQIEALQKQTSAPGSLTSLSTAEPQPTTAQAMATELNPKQGGTDKSSSDSAALDAVKPTRQLGVVPRGAIGAAIGLLLGIGLTILIERLDPRIRTKEQAELAYGWPVIAEVPPLTRKQQREAEVLVSTQPRSRTAEAFRVLRSAVLFAAEQHEDGASPTTTANGNGNGNGSGSGGASSGTGNGSESANGTRGANGVDASGTTTKPGKANDASNGDSEGQAASSDSDAPVAPPDERKRGRVILITSPGPSEGKTTTASNLAGAVAETGFRVLIVNCDFRRPRLAAFFHRQPGPGEILSTPVPGVDILNEVIADADNQNPATVLAAQRKAIHTHVREYDVVLLDTAPMLTTNDAVDILMEADAVLVVGRAGKTTREAADRAAEALDRRNAPVIGVVLVGAADSPSGRYYYYGDRDTGYYVSRKKNDTSTELAEADTRPT